MNDDVIRGILIERKRRIRRIKTVALLAMYSALAICMVIAVAMS